MTSCCMLYSTYFSNNLKTKEHTQKYIKTIFYEGSLAILYKQIIRVKQEKIKVARVATFVKKYPDFVRTNSYLPSTLSKCRNMEASGYTFCYEKKRTYFLTSP